MKLYFCKDHWVWTPFATALLLLVTFSVIVDRRLRARDRFPAGWSVTFLCFILGFCNQVYFDQLLLLCHGQLSIKRFISPTWTSLPLAAAYWAISHWFSLWLNWYKIFCPWPIADEICYIMSTTNSKGFNKTPSLWVPSYDFLILPAGFL